MHANVAPAFASAALALTAGLLWKLKNVRLRLRLILKSNYHILSEEERCVALRLLAAGQQTVLEFWPSAGIQDSAKRQLLRAAARKMDGLAAAVSDERLSVLQVPTAVRQPHSLCLHGEALTDDFHWLRDDSLSDPRVLGHLERESAYAAAVLADVDAVAREVHGELEAVLLQPDRSVFVRQSRWDYYVRRGGPEECRPVHCRRPTPAGAPDLSELTVLDESQREEVLVDENQEAERHNYYQFLSMAVCPEGGLVAVTEDTGDVHGARLRLVDKRHGRRRHARGWTAEGTAGAAVWAADSATLFYVECRHRTPRKVLRCTFDSDVAQEAACVFQEEDPEFSVQVGRTHDGAVLWICSSSAEENEFRLLSAAQPVTSDFQLLFPRQSRVKLTVEHWHNHLFVVEASTAAGAPTTLFLSPLLRPAERRTLLQLPEGADVDGFHVADRHLAILLRENGVQQVSIYELPDSGQADKIELSNPRKLIFGPDESRCQIPKVLALCQHGPFWSDVLMVAASSLAAAPVWTAVNMSSGQQSQRKAVSLSPSHAAVVERLVTQQLVARSHDGCNVPISLVYHPPSRGAGAGGGVKPLLLRVHGTHGRRLDPAFAPELLPLLERGIAVAYAHVRGGGCLGRRWHAAGKRHMRRNGVLDTVACMEHLVKEGWTSCEGLVLEARGPGAVLAAAAVNERPSLVKACVLLSPVLDVLARVGDDAPAAASGDRPEWGDIKSPDAFHSIKAFAPIENISKQAYPSMLITTSILSKTSCYWEAAKYVAKLRLMKTDDNLLLLLSGASPTDNNEDMEGVIDERALEYSYLLRVWSM